LEILLKNKLLSLSFVLILSTLIFSACNLPSRQTTQAHTPTPTTASILKSAPIPIPISLCDNQYFPNSTGDTWDYSGTNSVIGPYTRTDTITTTNAEAFTQQTNLTGVTYPVTYSCSSSGLTAIDPIQQYIGALLSSPNAPVYVKLTSNSGISLPGKIVPGDTWQQTASFEATSSELNLNGRFVFDYTAVGYENVTVPFGTFKALHVDTIIRIEVSGFRILAGTYTITSWMVTDVGIVKSEGASHVTGIEFTDNMELTGFIPSP
jgi:hypothetical protein